jgi:hypothetical protein
MEENEIMLLFKALEELNHRQNRLELENKKIAEKLDEQNSHISNIFKGYAALGIFGEDDGEMISEDAIKKNDFIVLINQLVAQNKAEVDNMLNQNDKFKLKRINEEYIVKKFELIDRRWYSILTYDKLWQTERLKAWNESMQIVEDLNRLDERSDTQLFDKYFARLAQLIGIQEKYMSNEEAHQRELFDLFDMRDQIIKEVDETFLL